MMAKELITDEIASSLIPRIKEDSGMDSKPGTLPFWRRQLKNGDYLSGKAKTGGGGLTLFLGPKSSPEYVAKFHPGNNRINKPRGI